MGTVKLGRIGTGITTALGAALILLAFAPTAGAAPGNPGVPGPPSAIFQENFENVPNPAAAQLLANYTGAPPVSMTYTAHPNWLNSSACNGVISSWNATATAGSCPIGIYNAFVRPIARGMGAVLGGGDDNQVMSDVTISGFAAAATPAATLQTVNPVPLSSANRFITFSIDAGAVTCGPTAAHPLLRFFLLDGSSTIPISNAAINACTDPRGATIPAGQTGAGVRVGSYASDGSILFSGSSLGVKMTNDQTSGSGNDYAVDNLRVLDATPQLDKEFDPPPGGAYTGQPFPLKFTITNTADLAAKKGWSFTDELPDGLEVADPAGATTDCPTGSVTASPGGDTIQVSGNLASNMPSCEATVDVVMPDTSPGVNEFENCAANITQIVGLDPPGCTTVQVNDLVDLSMEKSVDKAVADVGEQVTYTLSMHNAGPDFEPGAFVDDLLPPGLTYVSDDFPSGCDTLSSAPHIICGLGTIAAGQTRTFHITAEVGAGAASTVATNTGSVFGITFDPDLTNNTDTASTQVPPLADLRVQKTGPDVADIGEQFTYSVSVTNDGPSPAASATLTDTLPPGVTYVSHTEPVGVDCVVSAPEISCPLGSLPNGATRTIQITVSVNQDAGSTMLVNTAQAQSSTPDPNTDNNSDSARTAVPPLSDLSIDKSASPDPALAGQQLTYSLAVHNDGPTDSDPTTVTDTLPSGVTYVSDNSDCDTSNLPTISCDLGAIADGDTATVQIVTTVNGDTTGELTNSAHVDGPNPDPDPDNNTDSTTTEVRLVSDLAVTKTAPGVADIDTQFTYEITATNDGPSTSDPTALTDTLPDNLLYVSDDSDCDVSSFPQLSCDLGAMSSGDSRTVAITVQVQDSAASTVLDNTASVDGPNSDPDPDNNTASAQTLVPPLADLSVTKTADAESVGPGDQLTYTLEVANDGPTDSDPTTVTDTLPDGLDYVSDDSGCDTSALPEVSCDLGALASGESITVHIVTAVSESAGGDLTNTAEVSGPIPDPFPDNNASEITTTFVALPKPSTGKPKLSVKKRASTDGAHPGEVISYRITVRNKGKADARRVRVCDKLPNGQTLLSAPGADQSSDTRVCWKLKRLKAGAKRKFKVVTQIKLNTKAGAQKNKAVVNAANGRRSRDAAAVDVQPVGGPCPSVGSGFARC